MKHMFRALLSTTAVATILCTVVAAPAQETADGASAPATHTVKQESFTKKIELDGVFEAATMEEIVLRPEAWGSFRMIRSLAHGAGVDKDGILKKIKDLKEFYGIKTQRLEKLLG